MRTRASVATLIQLLVRDLLIFDVSADRLLVPPDGRNEVAPRPEFVAEKIAQLAFHILFPWPIQQRSATERFLASKKTSRGVR